MTKRLNNKVAIVTGGGRGIGRATALAFVREGAKVLVADIHTENSNETIKMIRDEGGEAEFVHCDVSKSDEVESMVKKTVEIFGRVDCAFNNAGIPGPQASIPEYSLEDWNSVIGVNLTGVFLCMKHQLKQMLEQGGGSIVNAASIMGNIAFPQFSAYITAKHGLIGITKAAALEFATQGIRVNAVSPGFIDTPMLSEVGIATNPPMLDAIVNLHPVKRLGKAEEVAEAVVWLSSDAASFITGQSLLIDGGFVAQ